MHNYAPILSRHNFSATSDDLADKRLKRKLFAILQFSANFRINWSTNFDEEFQKKISFSQKLKVTSIFQMSLYTSPIWRR